MKMKKQSAMMMSVALMLGASVMTSCGASQKEKQSAEASQKPKTEKTVAQEVRPVAFENAKMNAVYTNYVKLRDALRNDNTEEAMAASEALTTASKTYAAAAPIAKTATEISKAENLKAMRSAFASLNDEMIQLVQNEKISEGVAYVAHCPMAREGKGANWLSDSKEIQNPYFGSKMSKCGTIQSTLE